MTERTETGKLARPPITPDGEGEIIAYAREVPDAPSGPTGLTWLGGFKSDMTGTKATALADWAKAAERHFLRFDYFAHGASSGTFTEGTIGRWRDDALAMIDEKAAGPQILIGSSMGGWVALLAALARPDRVRGLVLIAPAPDFTQALMWEGFSDEVKETLKRDGIYRQPSEYDDEPYEISMNLIEEGREHLLLGKPVPLTCPVRILQGMKDEDVPWQHAMKLVETLVSDDVTISLSKSGDHRLSTPTDIARLTDEIEALIADLER